MSTLTVEKLKKRYGNKLVLDGVDLEVPPQGLTVIFGGPGSGKSTLLRIVAGLEAEDAGTVWLRGQDVTRAAPQDRRLAYVPQNFALYPQMTAFENIAYPLRLKRQPSSTIAPLVREIAQTLRIEDVLNQRPDQLSGGQKQRVAIARGLIKRADIYLLDDPLIGLDYKVRERLVEELRDLQERLGAIFLYATSDPLEALLLADFIVVLDQGRVVDSGQPNALYEAPRHLWTRLNLGFPLTNAVSGTLTKVADGWQVATPWFRTAVEIERPDDGERAVWATFRAERLTVDPPQDGSLLTFSAEIVLEEDIGAETVLYLVGGGTTLYSVVPHREGEAPELGTVTVGLRPDDVMLYDSSTQMAMGRGVATDGRG